MNIAIVTQAGKILSLHPTTESAIEAYFRIPPSDWPFVRMLSGEINERDTVAWNLLGGGYCQGENRLTVLDNPRTPIQQRWDAARQCPSGVFRKIKGGRPVSGEEGLIYPDTTTRDGYQIARASDAQTVAIGQYVRVGTGGKWNGAIGVVDRLGEPYDMVIDSVVRDEDHSYSGDRIVGQTKVSVRRIFLRDIQSI